MLITHSIIILFVHSLGNKAWIFIYFIIVVVFLTLATPRTVAHQAPLSMGFSRQQYWSGLPCPPPGDLPDPRIKPSLQVDSLPLSHQGNPNFILNCFNFVFFLILLEPRSLWAPRGPSWLLQPLLVHCSTYNLKSNIPTQNYVYPCIQFQAPPFSLEFPFVFILPVLLKFTQ